MTQPLIEQEAYRNSLKERGPGYSVELDGEIIAAAGVFMIWEGRGLAWALFTDKAIRNFRPIYRAIRHFYQTTDIRRVECYVETRHIQACKLAVSVGFKYECVMKAFFPDGSDAIHYSKVRS